MSTIRLPHNHSNEQTARWDISWSNNNGNEVTPETALTIASWWQSPGRTGYVLAGFASGAEVDRTELLNDIADTRRDEGYYSNTMSDEDKLALDMLSTFVIHFGEES